jgi:hypothetical protein
LCGRENEGNSNDAIDPDFLRADAVKIFADGVILHNTLVTATYLDGRKVY